jgi:hypothetical protein
LRPERPYRKRNKYPK